MTTFHIQKVYKLSGVGTVVVGQARSGALRIGMRLRLDGEIMEVKAIEGHHKKLEKAETGDTVAASLSNADEKLLRKWIGREVTFF